MELIIEGISYFKGSSDRKSLLTALESYIDVKKHFKGKLIVVFLRP